jgi:hypothetical protein
VETKMEKEKTLYDVLLQLEKASQEVDNTPKASGFANLLYFASKKNEMSKKIRFITDFKTASSYQFKFHQKTIKDKNDYRNDIKLYSHPCLTHYGLECPTCAMDSMPKQMFALTVYDYSNEYEPKRLLADTYGQCKMIPPLLNTFKLLKTLLGQDFTMTILNPRSNKKTYEYIPVDDSEAFDKEVVPYTEAEALEELKKDSFNFILPQGVVFEKLKPLSNDKLPF